MSYVQEKMRMVLGRGARDRAARGTAGGPAPLRVIPVTAWALAVLIWVGMLAFVVFFVFPRDTEMRQWSLIQKVPFAALLPLFLSVWVLLIGYVNGDAKRRQMRHVMWTLLAIFVPNAIGIILYFLLRDPLPAPCPSCGAMSSGAFSFCPHCGAALAPVCPHCRRTADRGWANCAYCGTRLSPAPPRAG